MQINDWWYDVHRQLTFKILPTPRNTSWTRLNLSHLVFVRLLHVAQFALETQKMESHQIKCSNPNLEVDTDLEIQISDIPGVWLHGEDTSDLLSLLACDVIVHVENGLGKLNINAKSQLKRCDTNVNIGHGIV